MSYKNVNRQVNPGSTLLSATGHSATAVLAFLAHLRDSTESSSAKQSPISCAGGMCERDWKPVKVPHLELVATEAE